MKINVLKILQRLLWGVLAAGMMLGSREMWLIGRASTHKDAREAWLGLEKTQYSARLRITGSQNHAVETAEDLDHNGSYDSWTIEMNNEDPELHIVYNTKEDGSCGYLSVKLCGGQCASISYPNPICAPPDAYSIICLMDQSAQKGRTCCYYDYDQDSKVDVYKTEILGSTTLWHIEYQDSLLPISAEPYFEQGEWKAQSLDSGIVYVFQSYTGWAER